MLHICSLIDSKEKKANKIKRLEIYVYNINVEEIKGPPSTSIGYILKPSF